MDDDIGSAFRRASSGRRRGMSVGLLVLILAADLAITLLHSYQEWKGPGAPLWCNFGAIAGLDVLDRWGFLGFSLILTLTMFVIGLVGILGLLWPRITRFAL